MKSKYSESFKEQALTKVFSRGDRTIQSVADELNVSLYNLKAWMKKSVHKTTDLVPKTRRPQDWSAEKRLAALNDSHDLSGESLNAWCRERGIFTHHLTAWRTDFCNVAKSTTSDKDLRVLKNENEQLKRDLARKEKALAEAAALLILQKKYHALWGEEDK